MYGAPANRTRAFLDLPQIRFDLKDLITEQNLKTVGFLSEHVGTRVPYKRFRNGTVLKEKKDKHHVKDSDSENSSSSEGIDDGARPPLLYVFFFIFS